MKRTRIDQAMIADYHTLVNAACKASLGKRNRPDVGRFFSDFDTHIQKIREDLISGIAPYNHFRNFTIHDPKKRVITAVGFEDRVIHHALMNSVSPVLEKAMIPFSYACRPGKGPLKAVFQAQENIRKYPWYVKIDIRKYFETIDHQILFHLLCRKFKGRFFSDLVGRILHGYSTAPGKGLPIGSLTSQHFANYYLDGADRLVLERSPALAYVRYMDDMVWWAEDRVTAKKILRNMEGYLNRERLLCLKDNIQIQSSLRGLTFCGFRVLPGSLGLTKRKKRRYVQRRKYWEGLFLAGHIDANHVQNAYDSVGSVVAHASSLEWRKQALTRHPAPEV